MKITYRLLKRKRACSEGLRWFRKNFPDGCELRDEVIAKISDCPADFIWWFYNNVQQDRRLYALVGVSDSFGINCSNGVNNSDGVNRSNGVNRSFGVNGSDDVNWSDGVNNSDGVNWSEGVDCSFGVNESKGVSWSFGVVNSFGVDCAMFLVDKPRTYSIFGQEVSEDRYEEVFCILHSKLGRWRPTFNNIKTLRVANRYVWKETPVYNARDIAKEDAWKDMPKAAVNYVKSLPEFDADIFYKITGIK